MSLDPGINLPTFYVAIHKQALLCTVYCFFIKLW